MRCADFGPMPGSRPSSSTRSWITPGYTPASAEKAGEAGIDPEIAECVLAEGTCPRRGVAHRREDEVLEQVDLGRVDDPRVDAHSHRVEGSGHPDQHGTV